jgi:peptidoglycan/LPS O-acetylase OafA/YrhL
MVWLTWKHWAGGYGPNGVGWQVFYLFTYVQNVWMTFAYVPAMNYRILLGPAWSLCIEEQFYLFWPLTLRRSGAATAVFLLYGAVGVSILGRIACYFLIPHMWYQDGNVGNKAEAVIYYFTLTRLDSIGIECLWALLIDRVAVRPELYSSKALSIYIAIALALIFFGMHCKPFYYTVGSAVIAFWVGAVIVALWLGATNTVSRILSARPLVEIGKVSYGVYIFQTIPLTWFLGRVAPQVIMVHFEWLIWVVVIIAIAEVHYRLVEKPLLSIRPH